MLLPFEHRRPLRPELVAGLPFRELVRVGDSVSDGKQQFRVFCRAAEIPVRTIGNIGAMDIYIKKQELPFYFAAPRWYVPGA